MDIDLFSTHVLTADRQREGKKKVRKSISVKRDNPKVHSNCVVLNLLNRQILQNKRSVLERGVNVAITPNLISVEKVIVNIEPAIRQLDAETAEEVGVDLVNPVSEKYMVSVRG